ncbi:MAG: hypothetical protein F6K11_20005 [Leptolyngbya sp. SIO3F4]|nr:hypothetical protein [Leptolyngbya sp. SIO3F4]
MRIALGKAVIGGLFAVAAVGLLLANWQPLDSLCIALALALLCVDQGRMALVDLNNIRQVTLEDIRVKRFNQVTLITIVLELIGFYWAWLQLGVGTTVVLISQLFFNTMAKIQLYADSLDPIKPFGLQERSSVLMANTVALGLTVMWQLKLFHAVAAVLLLTMVIVYLGIKYLTGSATNTNAAANGAENP